jgi:translation initiation factor 4E
MQPRVFWLDSWASQGNSPIQTLVGLGEANTPKSFWNLYEKNPVNALQLNCSLHVFRQKVKPEWEDPQCITGGHFRIAPSGRTSDGAQLATAAQKLWWNLLTTHIGEKFSHSDAIVGCGFTNKGIRQIASVWINTNDETIVAALERDLKELVTERFSIKYISHRQIIGDSTSQSPQIQLRHEHRRTRSAPGKIIAVDDSDDDGAAQQDAATAGQTSLKDRRRGIAQLELDTTDVSDAPHQRSRSDGQSREVIPSRFISAPKREAPPTSGPLQQPSIEFTESSAEFKSSGSGVLLPPSAPTPLKDWASGWSPSLLEAALRAEAQSKAMASLSLSQEPPPPPQPPKAVASSLHNSLEDSAERKPAFSYNPYGYATMMGPADFGSALPRPQPGPRPTSPAREPTAKSDACAFVFNGWLFPMGLNRKERRRICFSTEVDPSTYPGAVFVGPEQADGPRTHEEELALRAGNSSGSVPAVVAEGKKWAGATS